MVRKILPYSIPITDGPERVELPAFSSILAASLAGTEEEPELVLVADVDTKAELVVREFVLVEVGDTIPARHAYVCTLLRLGIPVYVFEVDPPE